MSFESQLEKNMESLSGLKKCLGSEEISNLLLTLRSEWNPKSKEFNGIGIHGSKKGEPYCYTLYWDQRKCLWTSKEMAFKSFVMDRVTNALVLLYPKLFNEL